MTTETRILADNQRLTIIRHQNYDLVSVYRDNTHLGLIYPPLHDERSTFDVRPTDPVNGTYLDNAACATEQEAIDHLVNLPRATAHATAAKA